MINSNIAIGSRVRMFARLETNADYENGTGTVIDLYPANRHEPAGAAVRWDDDQQHMEMEYDQSSLILA